MFILPSNIQPCASLLRLEFASICNESISTSLVASIKYHKRLIEDYKTDWDLIKKQVNPYEYIHSYILNRSYAVSIYRPLSRSYYKLIELYSTFKISDYFTGDINTFHLAEGPGGFMEAILHLRNNKKDTYIGMTLTDGTNCPGWKQNNILTRAPNIILDTGADGTGNILNPANFAHCNDKYKRTMDLVTADGGFDFSNDYNGQEQLSSKLIFAEVIYALILQKPGGTFILKIFDCFLQTTNEILYLLSMLYEKVHITKPNTSRCANSERYVVCLNFKNPDNYVYYNIFHTMLQQIQTTQYIHSILNVPVPLHFLNVLEEINTLLAQTQIEYINKTISYIKYKNIPSNLLHININKCITWCKKHNVDINTKLHDIKHRLIY